MHANKVNFLKITALLKSYCIETLNVIGFFFFFNLIPFITYLRYKYLKSLMIYI